jgi:small subunit ribosomal protein S6
MNEYEILLMLDPELPEERQGEIVQRVREIVEKGGGSWVAAQPWGRRRLAYEIDKKNEGVYHLLSFDSEPPALDEATRVLKITDGVMRHMATRRIAVPSRPPAPAAVGAGSPEEYPAPSESETQGGA